DDVLRVVERLRVAAGAPWVVVGFLDCNQPDIPAAIDLCVERGASEIVAIPYFLHSGKHVLRDIPRLLLEGEARHPGLTILMADYLGHDPFMADILLSRAREAH
ncbi:MAG TPA: CbiX/SirB N-terminal domain-containing protein, partial [Thermoanaerobaculia bacterium]|nr:CbiX/SirB N-terminal domain-containing protein [Thermoanaerobaculia bacterium]